MTQLVQVELDASEYDQEGSFMNATLQSAGEAVAMSIATSLEVPVDVIARGQQAIAEYVQTVLSAAAGSCNGLNFEVQIGPSREAMRKLRGQSKPVA